MIAREFVVVVTGAEGKSVQDVADMLRYSADQLAEHILHSQTKYVPGAEVAYLDDLNIDLDTGEVGVRT